MAIRVRKDGTMWCAAHTEEMEGDTYIDDGEHYYLSVEQGLIVALPMPEHEKNPQWWWKGNAPSNADFTFAEQPAGRALPEGWQLVPKEPTRKMVAAGKHTIKGADTTFESILAAAAYSSMLEAAPKFGE